MRRTQENAAGVERVQLGSGTRADRVSQFVGDGRQIAAHHDHLPPRASVIDRLNRERGGCDRVHDSFRDSGVKLACQQHTLIRRYISLRPPCLYADISRSHKRLPLILSRTRCIPLHSWVLRCFMWVA